MADMSPSRMTTDPSRWSNISPYTQPLLVYREFFFQGRNTTTWANINLAKKWFWQISRFPSRKENQPTQLHTHRLHTPVQDLLKCHMSSHRNRPYIPHILPTHPQQLAYRVSPSTLNSLTVWGSLGWVIDWQLTPKRFKIVYSPWPTQ